MIRSTTHLFIPSSCLCASWSNRLQQNIPVVLEQLHVVPKYHLSTTQSASISTFRLQYQQEKYTYRYDPSTNSYVKDGGAGPFIEQLGKEGNWESTKKNIFRWILNGAFFFFVTWNSNMFKTERELVKDFILIWSKEYRTAFRETWNNLLTEQNVFPLELTEHLKIAGPPPPTPAELQLDAAVPTLGKIVSDESIRDVLGFPLLDIVDDPGNKNEPGPGVDWTPSYVLVGPKASADVQLVFSRPSETSTWTLMSVRVDKKGDTPDCLCNVKGRLPNGLNYFTRFSK